MLWIVVILFIILIAIVSEYNSNKCLRSYYLPYPVWDPSDPIKMLFTMDLNVYLSNCPNLGSIPVPNGFTVEKIRSHNDIYGYVFESDSAVIIAFSGTFNYRQWKLDLETELVPAPSLNNSTPNLKIHKGFYFIYEGMIDQLRSIDLQNKDLYITGISLGGAISSVVALNLAEYNPQVYTFASPKVYNLEGARLVDKLVPNITRIYNTEDIVPRFPFNQNYAHVGKSQPFTIDLESNIKNHTDAYVQKILYT